VQRVMQNYRLACTDLQEKTVRAHTLAIGAGPEPGAYRTAISRHLQEQGVPVDAIDQLAALLHDTLASALEIARTVCTTQQPSDRHYLPRTVQRRVAQLGQLTCLLKVGRKALEAIPGTSTAGVDELLTQAQDAMLAETNPASTSKPGGRLNGLPDHLVHDAITGLKEHLPAEGAPQPPPQQRQRTDKPHRHRGRGAGSSASAEHPTPHLPQPGPAQPGPGASPAQTHADHDGPVPPATAHVRMLQAIERYLQEIRGERRTLRRCDQLRLYRKAVEAWRAKYAKLPRWGHKDIKNSSDDAPQGIEVLRDPDSGELTTDPQRKLGILHSMLQRLSAAPAGSKAGTYTTDTAAPRGYPWEAADATDSFTMRTRVDPTAPREDLLPRILDYNLFKDCLNSAANNKAAGSDAVPNELLKFLTECMHAAIHQMFVSMWITGDTPTAWKCSHTVMLYKKGDPADPTNYRPIGLARTVYKLWTSLVTRVLSDYAERNSIIGDSQEGFRGGRNTHRQLANLLNALEDAKHTNRNIYVMYVDFSSAFNTVDHDKLLQLMWDMGFPMHAV
jgi:hypothetical protein